VSTTEPRLDRNLGQDYVVDTRPLCSGMQFVLTDSAHPRMVLKNGSHFLVLDEMAQVPSCNSLGYGYYRNDTRHLSQWEITLNGVPLSLLSSDLQKGYSGRFLYTNPQMDGIPQQKITVERQVVLDDLLWEHLTIENFGPEAYDIELEMKFHNDFADMFEVRGLNRNERGERMLPACQRDNSALYLAYRGLDGVLLETVVDFTGQKPTSIQDGSAVFQFQLPVRSPIQIAVCVKTRMDYRIVPALNESVNNLRAAKQSADEHHRQWRSGVAHLETGHELFNLCIERAINDLYILRQPTPKGFGLAAGLPWYASVFGRDSAIAGLQALPFAPELARECLEVLAAYQGQQFNEYKAEEPGKIMHELRLGELARTGQIPHAPYYGTVDATQLWIMLFCEYFKWSGDMEFATGMWPAVKLAVNFLNKAVSDGDGYIRYSPSPTGLINQGWKDSDDSIMHLDGKLADAPIAVSEAQAYLYLARQELAKIADIIGQSPMAEKLRSDAEELKARFQRDFWMPTEKFVCLALDGHNHQVGVISSNAGHALWCGILDEDKAHAVADKLMEPHMYSGWGIRTLSDRTVAFNPVSYHNGTVWPHDNAIIGEGMRKLGRVEDMKKIMQGIVEVSMNDGEHRLPELFCGFDRGGTLKPVEYPVSCSPQAWAAGGLLHMLGSCLNFQADARNRVIKIVEPALPDWFGNLTIRGLRVGTATLDISFESQPGSTYAKVLRKSGTLRVIVEN
jgi:glycogen debranching enzyme